MEGIFLTILRMSLRASVVILAVLLGRLALRRAPKRWSYVLWAAVGFRLACPVSVLWTFSLFRLLPGLTSPVGTGTRVDYAPLEVSTAPAAPQITQNLAPQVSIPASVPTAPTLAPEETLDLAALLWKIGTALWLLGLAVMLLAALWQYLRLRRQLVGAVQVGERIYETDRIPSPFILGLLPPKIYLPLGLEGQARSYVLSHERYHIRHLDPVVRLAAYGLLSIHWFNPLVWLAFRLMGRDMELRCDEAVMQQWGGGADYSRTLLQVATQGRFPGPAPLAFGETDVKTRIKNALNWKKPTIWVSLAALALCAVLVAVCVTNPGGKRSLEEILGVPLDQVTHVEAQTIVGRFADGKLQNDSYQLTLEGEDAQALLAILERASFRQKLRFQSTFENMEAHADLWLTDSNGPLGWCSFVDGVMNLEGKSYKLDPAITAELQDYIVEHGQKQEDPEHPVRLTLDALKALVAMRGEDLDWSDFEDYPHEDVGSGLVIWWIPLSDQPLAVRIGGVPGEKPWYSHLCAIDDQADYVDLLTGNVDGLVRAWRHYSFPAREFSGWLSDDDAVLAYILEHCSLDGMKLTAGQLLEAGGEEERAYKRFSVTGADGRTYEALAEGAWRAHKLLGRPTQLGPEMKVDTVWISPARRRTDLASGTYYLERTDESISSYRFWIRINTEKGNFQYYETPISSYIGMGLYQLEGDVLTISDGLPTTEGTTQRVNRFRVGDGKLTWIAQGSDGFLFAKLQNGDIFTLGPDNGEFLLEDEQTQEALPDLSDVSGWAQLDPGDPSIYVPMPSNLDLGALLPLLREAEEVPEPEKQKNFWLAELDYGEGPSYSSADPHLLLAAGLPEDIVEVYSTAFRRTSHRFLRNPALYALLRNCYASEPGPLDPDISKYQPILEECAQREMDAYNKSSLENIGEITGFEIVQFQRADSFPSPEEARYTVYQWDAAFTLSDPDKVFLAGGVYLDSAQRLRRNVPGVFVVDALTGESHFLVEETFSLSSDDAASRQNTWNAILEAFDVRRGTTQEALPDLSDVSGWAQLDPGDPRIHVSAPHNLDLREILTLLREGEDYRAPMIKPNEWFAELYYSEGLVESSADPHLLLTSGGWEGVVAIWINTPGSSPRFQRNPALDALLRSCCASEPVHREPDYSKYQPTEIYECKDVSFYHIPGFDPDYLRPADKVEQQEDGTYHLPFDTSVFIDFYDGKGLKPARAYFMQEGTSQARELCYANPQWPQMPLGLRLTFTEDETEGKLWFVFDRGDGTCVRTEPISIVIEHAASEP